MAMVDISGLMSDPAINVECVATEEMVARMEQAVTSGRAIPLPPEPVVKLYRHVFRELPLLKLNDGAMLSDTTPSIDAAVAARVPPVQKRNPTLSSNTRQDVTIRPDPDLLVHTLRLPYESP